jgi:hypothetical protein
VAGRRDNRATAAELGVVGELTASLDGRVLTLGPSDGGGSDRRPSVGCDESTWPG